MMLRAPEETCAAVPTGQGSGLTLQTSAEAGRIPVFTRHFGSWTVAVQRKVLSEQDLITRYDQAARGWDKVLHRFRAAEAYAALIDQALGVAKIDLPGRALDCGTGTGALSIALAERAPGAFRQDAVDISPRMLAHARARFAEHGLPITTQSADIRALPYASRTFDLTMSAHVCEHLADPHAGVAELARVTRPGGVVLLCISRRSLAGRLVQLRWRTHVMSTGECAATMRDVGLEDVRPLKVSASSAFRRLSVACIGRVPA